MSFLNWWKRTFGHKPEPVFLGCSNWNCGPVVCEFDPDDLEGQATWKDRHKNHKPGIVRHGLIKWEKWNG